MSSASHSLFICIVFLHLFAFFWFSFDDHFHLQPVCIYFATPAFLPSSPFDFWQLSLPNTCCSLSFPLCLCLLVLVPSLSENYFVDAITDLPFVRSPFSVVSFSNIFTSKFDRDIESPYVATRESLLQGGAGLLRVGTALPVFAIDQSSRDVETRYVATRESLLPGGAGLLRADTALPVVVIDQNSRDVESPYVATRESLLPVGADLLRTGAALPVVAIDQSSRDVESRYIATRESLLPGGAGLLRADAALPVVAIDQSSRDVKPRYVATRQNLMLCRCRVLVRPSGQLRFQVRLALLQLCALRVVVLQFALVLGQSTGDS